MAKKYNMSKKSDMRKFSKDLEKSTNKIIEKTAKTMKVDVACPHCEKNIQVTSGKNTCPNCKKIVNLNVDY